MVPFLIGHILLIVVVGAVVAIGQMLGITKHERPAIPQWAEWKAPLDSGAGMKRILQIAAGVGEGHSPPPAACSGRL
jgi:hypothetical protein